MNADARAVGVDTLWGVWKTYLGGTSPRLLVAFASLASALRLLAGPPGLADLLLVLGVLLFWPMQEWLIHVFILHFKPRKIFGRTVDLRTARAHRAHHRRSWIVDLVFMPPAAAILGVPVLAVVAFLALPTPALALTALMTYLLLASYYEWVHLLCHVRYHPRTRWYRRLVRNHRLHHCKNEHYWMGVSMTSGDRLLGTNPNPRAVPTSRTCRDLLASVQAVPAPSS